MIPNELHHHIATNNYETVKYLIKENIFETRDCFCYVTTVRMLDLLIDLGLKIEEHPYVIIFYVYNDYIDLVERAIYHGLDINYTYGKETVFHNTFNCPNIIPDLVKLGADINLVPEGGKTALSFSILNFNIENWTMSLLNAGADPNVSDSYSFDTFDYALTMNKEVVFNNMIKKDIRMGASA